MEGTFEYDETDELAVPSFYAGDMPSTPLVFRLSSTDDFTGWTVGVALDKSGSELFPLGAATVTRVEHSNGDFANVVSAAWPAYAVGPKGIWSIVVTLTKGVRRLVLDGPQVVIEETRTGWHTLASARASWSDAQQLSNVQLFEHLEAARVAVVNFAPFINRGPGMHVPEAHRLAQLLQARSLWNVSKSNTGSEVIAGEFGSITIRPLDSNVRALLRPKSGVPVIA
jgi:hypothetical protein